jgi:hypothetical protein
VDAFRRTCRRVTDVTRYRSSAFEREIGKPEYSTAVVVPVALNDIDATITSHGMRVLARPDQKWKFARTLLD